MPPTPHAAGDEPPPWLSRRGDGSELAPPKRDYGAGRAAEAPALHLDLRKCKVCGGKGYQGKSIKHAMRALDQFGNFLGTTNRTHKFKWFIVVIRDVFPPDY